MRHSAHHLAEDYLATTERMLDNPAHHRLTCRKSGTKVDRLSPSRPIILIPSLDHFLSALDALFQ